MKLGLMLGYWMAGPEDPIDLVLEAERLGYDSVWTAEAYGSDAVAPLCWMGARTTPLKLIGQPLRSAVPIFLGAMGPRNIALAKEIADGWLPLYMSPYRMRDVYGDLLDGFRPEFEIACPVQVVVGDDVAQCLFPVKITLAFYIGGMGHRTKNFSKEQVARMGYADAADRVQQLFLEGRRGEAIAAVPDELADEIALCGPPARIRERLGAWRKTPG